MSQLVHIMISKLPSCYLEDSLQYADGSGHSDAE